MHKCLELLSSGKDVLGQRHAFLLRRARCTRSLFNARHGQLKVYKNTLLAVTAFVLLVLSSCLVQHQFHQQVMFERTLRVCEIPCYPRRLRGFVCEHTPQQLKKWIWDLDDKVNEGTVDAILQILKENEIHCV